MTAHANPFPGMDPYFEERWREVHARLIVYASNQLSPQMPSDLEINIEGSVAVCANGDYDHTRRPDLHISEDDSRGFGDGAEAGVVVADAVSVAEPLVMRIERIIERRLEVVDAAGRLITAIEFISPWNKLGARARARYALKQDTYLSAGVNLVEIDLIRRGETLAPITAEDYPLQFRPMYMVCVYPAEAPENIEVYRAPLRQRLPNSPVPLRPGERDAVLQLQPLIDDCYRDGQFYRTNYDRNPDPPLPPADAEWLDKLLREKGLRQSTLAKVDE